MNCSSAENKLRAYLDNELRGSEKGEFIVHLARCKECTRKLDMAGEGTALLRKFRPQRAPEGFSKRLATRIGGMAAPAKPSLFERLSESFREHRTPALVGACALLLAAGLSAISGRIYQPNTAKPGIHAHNMDCKNPADTTYNRPGLVDNFYCDATTCSK
jgi:anti-sigma factor RsiW